MSFPNFAGKHAHEALVNPDDFVAYFRRTNPLLNNLVLPDGFLFCYQQRLAQTLIADLPHEPILGLPAKCMRVEIAGGAVGVCMGFGIGAPAATALLELLIALGARRFTSIGTAGTLQPTCPVGSIVLCDRAIRDEGVSHHYLPPALHATPSPAMTTAFAAALAAAGITPTTGTTWTIDAPYRETVEEARHYQQQGVLTVEMEAAALFAVAQVRGVELASGFVISDSLAELTWDPQFQSAAVAEGYAPLFRAACATLVG